MINYMINYNDSIWDVIPTHAPTPNFHYKMRDDITYPFLNFISAFVEV